MNALENPSRILIVDDDPAIRELLTDYLREQEYLADAVGDGLAMNEWLKHQKPDLIIMDLMLPGEDGLSLTRRISDSGNIPIIMLTAKGDEIDRIIGLEMGADDYLPKPFNPRELLARIRAVLRRNKQIHEMPDEQKNSSVCFGPYELDAERMTLKKHGEEVVLTAGEMGLLVVLASRPGKIWSRDQLMTQVSGHDRDPFDRSIDVRVTRLRSKIESDPHAPRYLRTVWGKGYRFILDEED